MRNVGSERGTWTVLGRCGRTRRGESGRGEREDERTEGRGRGRKSEKRPSRIDHWVPHAEANLRLWAASQGRHPQVGAQAQSRRQRRALSPSSMETLSLASDRGLSIGCTLSCPASPGRCCTASLYRRVRLASLPPRAQRSTLTSQRSGFDGPKVWIAGLTGAMGDAGPDRGSHVSDRVPVGDISQPTLAQQSWVWSCCLVLLLSDAFVASGMMQATGEVDNMSTSSTVDEPSSQASGSSSPRSTADWLQTIDRDSSGDVRLAIRSILDYGPDQDVSPAPDSARSFARLTRIWNAGQLEDAGRACCVVAAFLATAHRARSSGESAPPASLAAEVSAILDQICETLSQSSVTF